jgi:hypothetical protein
MHTLRLSAAAALIVSSVLSIAWAFSSAGCGGNFVWICASPTGVDLGTANNGDSSYGACPCACCLSGPINGHPYPQGDCPFADAGAEGGPLPCSGECVPLPPPGWTPVLLWTGMDDVTAGCPDVALDAVFDGYASDGTATFALACTSTASGTCSGMADVCGPGPAPDTFRSCIMQAGDLDCVSLGSYPEQHVYLQSGPVQPSPFTFCCATTRIPSREQ